jgi:hypothetical protein
VKAMMREMPNWATLTPAMRESLDMTIHKIHRILTGEPSEVDHWKDIGGYSELIVRILKGEY